MPEDAQSTLQGLLSILEDATNSHCNLLVSLKSALRSCEVTTYTDADRILQICRRYQMDMQCALYVLSIKSLLIGFCKAKPFLPEVDFFPSALAILEFLKYNCSKLVENNLRKLSFLVLMSHPQEVLSKLVKDHSPTLIETFGLFLSANATLDAKVESLDFLQLLNCLPAYEKSVFVRQGIQLWLSGVLPTIAKALISIEDVEKAETYLGYVELLTVELVKYNYFEYPEWENFLQNVVDQNKFPMYTLSLLEKGKPSWHRIWIMIIKLLLDYVTRSGGSIYTIINSMLPMVETALKRGDSTQRVRALACWNELIKNFAIETKSDNMGKRVKLIVIPLKLNNAKTEDAATAKFYTWWLLIRKFKPKLDVYADEILIPFLHFLFGEKNLTKPTFWAGEVSERMKTKCLQAFVELIGHSDCKASSSRCTNIKPLEGDGGVLTTVMLADHWNDWMYALKTAVKIVAMNYNPESKKNVRCIWKSLALLVTGLVDDTVRRYWFNDLVKLLTVFVEESAMNKDALEIVIKDLVMPMFTDDRVQTLLDSKSPDHRPMHTIVKVITDKTFDKYYNRYEQQVLTTILQPLVTRLLSESLATPEYMILLLEELPQTDSSLMLWTALVQATPQLNLCLQALSAILKWPFKMMSVFTDVQDAALAWSTVYNAVHAKLDKIGFVEEISKVLIKPVEESSAENYFILFALIAVLKHKPDDDKMAKLEALTYKMSNCEDFEPLIPSLVETLTLTIDKMPALENENLAHLTLNCVRNIFKLLDSHAKLNDNDNTLTRKEIAVDEAKPCILYLNTKVLSDTIMLALETYLAKCSNETIKNDIIDSIALLEESHKLVIASLEKTDVAQKELASPEVQEVENNRKKEARIAKTVVENGEESAFVKSNKVATPKDTKSPRMALKDKVFRNVRNLIEKSPPSPRIEILHDVLINTVRSPIHKPNIEVTEKVDALNQIDNVSKSPVPEPKPIGWIGKSKKLDDSPMPVLKKNRLSNNESQTDSQEPSTQPEITVALVHTSNDNNKQGKVIRNKGLPVNTDDVLESVLPKNKVKDVASKSTIKKNKTSRIEKELMIDMVEGHPFFNANSEKRLTRKKMTEVANRSRRKSLGNKLNKSKLETTKKSTRNLKQKKSFNISSEDIIGSSQYSTSTTVSVNSKRRSPTVVLQRVDIIEKMMATQDLIQDTLTENMDTELMVDINDSVDIIVNNTESAPKVINLGPVVGPETQELAEANTQPNDPEKVILDVTPTLPVAASVNINNTKDVSSPFEDEDIKNQDFLSNTFEIAPIKIQSPERQEQSPSPETSSDYYVVKLSYPEDGDDEPYELISPFGIFTKNKVTADERDASPPRVEIAVTDSSPSSSLLMLQRTLPSPTSSPSGSILKRKLIDITDEATASTSSKRKRVSFRDPPVSTSVFVHKYIETDDTQNTSLDITPVVEIVKTSELNDTDPFYPDLYPDVDEISSTETLTVVEPMLLACTQTNDVCVPHTSMQTDESGSKTTEDTISSCSAERRDFIEKLCETLDEDSIKTIAEKLPTEVIFDMLIKKSENLTTLLHRMLEHHSRDVPNDKKSIAELSFLGDSLSKRYKSKDLNLHCIRVLENIIHKSD